MINESNSNATTPKERHSVYLSEDVNKSRKFRWSSCFSFITTKFKKSKLQKNRLSHSFSDEFEHKNYVPENISPVEKVEVKSVGASASASWKQQLNTTSSLSPPPRQTKNKRDSSMSQKIDNNNNVKRDRRPLIDPTLTPRVKPRSIKTSKNQPSLLRLSLDAELLQSPDGIYTLQDNESNPTTSHSSLSFSPTSQYPAPFRSGTLGAVKNPKLKMDNENNSIPPLPKINILDKRPQSQSTTHSNLSYITDSPTSMQSGVEFIADEEEKLTLKERRHRRSPLSMPDIDQLTLALKSQPSTTTVEEIIHTNNEIVEEDDQLWRQQLLEQTIAYSFQNNKSRQDAMMILEGKKPRAISLQPIVAVRKLDDHFCTDNNKNKKGDVVKDKAQYDAIVSRTQLSHEEKKFSFNNYRTSSSSTTTTNEKKMLQETQPLGIIAENEIITTTTTTPISANKMLLFTNGHRLSVTPETPPHHQLNAPSLISAPSTPNSIDSSVLEHDDYDRLHQLGFVSQ